MREAHGRPVLAGKRESGASESISPVNSPAQKTPTTGNNRSAPSSASSRSRDGRSNDALLANLENRLQRMGGIITFFYSVLFF